MLAETASARGTDSARVLRRPTSGVPREAVIAFVRDAKRGEVTVMRARREVTYRDKALVKRLLKAAPESEE